MMLPTFANSSCTGPALSVVGYLSGRCIRTLYGSTIVAASTTSLGVTATNCSDSACSVNCQSVDYGTFMCSSMGNGLWVAPYALGIKGVPPPEAPGSFASAVSPSVNVLILALLVWFALSYDA